MSEDLFVLRPGTILALEAGAAAYLARSGGRIRRGEASVYAAARSAGAPARRSPTIAVIEVTGFISPGIPSWLGTDPNEARAAVRKAKFAGAVDGIALLVDSPGGTTTGVEELFEEVLDARDLKPTAALVSGMAGSAAYYIASAARRIFATPSGELGSVGVFAFHASMAGALEKEGIEVTLIRSRVSPFKAETNPFQPLGEEAESWIQREVDRIAERFVSDVARARGFTRDAVAASFGRGRMLDAREAVRRGMADEVATPEDALYRVIEADREPRARACLDHRLERGLTAKEEMDLAKYSEDEEQQRAAWLRLLGTV